ncbi:hypothetical protein [Hydrocarboniclastica marina]|uniref:Uncharacterized protein n=1 Tax=Hydrocarboniclastica marina TaxID=2259620 RepID=A0A4V1D8K0_9ALTE|nr:hypothetical protein [Hydrocarboniclastica marina]QCF25460.1 hypothetical protein soil367_05700 [Hydrocarboniclastica marina]
MLSQFFAGVGVIVLLGFVAYLGYDTRRRTLSLREAREKASARTRREPWSGWAWVGGSESEPRRVWVGERGSKPEPDPEIVEERKREPRRRPVRAAAPGRARELKKSYEEEVEELRRSIEKLSQKTAAAAKRTPPKSEEDDG